MPNGAHLDYDSVRLAAQPALMKVENKSEERTSGDLAETVTFDGRSALSDSLHPAVDPRVIEVDNILD